MQTLDARCDQESIQLHLAGDGMGDHVADNHAVAALLELFQCAGDLIGAMHR
ncbi:hypothetical protein D3C81_2187830 [compost metagenome]